MIPAHGFTAAAKPDSRWHPPLPEATGRYQITPFSRDAAAASAAAGGRSQRPPSHGLLRLGLGRPPRPHRWRPPPAAACWLAAAPPSCVRQPVAASGSTPAAGRPRAAGGGGP